MPIQRASALSFPNALCRKPRWLGLATATAAVPAKLLINLAKTVSYIPVRTGFADVLVENGRYNLRKICGDYMPYIWQRKQWPDLRWEEAALAKLLTHVSREQSRLLGKMEGLGFDLRTEAHLRTLTIDVVKSSEIEGEKLPPEQVRSSIARHLGMDVAGLTAADGNVEGIVEMMMDATSRYEKPLTTQRLFDWHASLFPTGRSGMRTIKVGGW